MSEKRKRTDRKSQSLRSKNHGAGPETGQGASGSQPQEHADQSSRVMDMSWAAKYLDDDWEGKYSRQGGYDTKANAHAKMMALKSGSVDLMSQTQEFKPLNDDEQADDLKIRDAVTDKTIVELSESKNVRDAVKALDKETDGYDDGDLKIRDAVTDKTIVQIDEVNAVREAAVQAASDPHAEEDADFKIRDAVTDKTIVQIDEVQEVRDAAAQAAADKHAEEVARLKIRDAVTDKTIVQIEDSKAVRDAAALSGGKPAKPSAVKEPSMTAALKEDLIGLTRIRDAATSGSSEQDSSGSGRKDQALPPSAPKAAVSEPAPETGRTVRVPAGKKGKSAQSVSVTGILNDVIKTEESSAREEPAENRRAKAPSREKQKDARRKSENKAKVRHIPDETGRRSGRNEKPVYRDREEERYYSRRPVYYAPVKSPLRFIPLVLVIAICVLGFITARVVCMDVPVNAGDYSKISYTVEEGLTNEMLSSDLKELGLIDNPLVFKLRCIFYDADYVPGTYELSPCYSTEKIINILSGYKYGNDE